MKPARIIDMPEKGLNAYNDAWIARGRPRAPRGYIVAWDQEGQRTLTLPYPVIAGQEIKTLRQILHHLKRGDRLTMEKAL